MTDNTPDPANTPEPENTPDPANAAPQTPGPHDQSPLPAAMPPASPGRPGRRALIVAAAVAVLLAGGGGATWWALADDGDAMSHVEVAGGKLVADESSEDCDDTDVLTYNDCDIYTDSDTDTTYEFVYKITNKGGGHANYYAIVNAFDEDGEFVGQTYITTTHLAPGKTDADKDEFNDYSILEDGHELSDIASVKVAHVERTELAN